MCSGQVWAYWYYHIPNYVLAAAMYTLLGRFGLSFFVPPDWENYIWRGFLKMTDPIVAAVRFITPLAVPELLLLPIGWLWLLMIRVVFTLVMTIAGLTPPVDALPAGQAGG